MNTLAPVVTCLLSASTLLAQGLLHYKFDEHCGDEVINFAAGSAVGNATIVTTSPGGVAAARVAGQFDQALTGTAGTIGPTTRLNTGWAPSTLSGSFSFSMWIRNTPGNPTALPFGYLFGATGGNFRLFTGSSGFLFLSGVPGGATSNVNLTTLVNAGWVHVACTVDATTSQAIWYTNGAPDAPDALTGGVLLAGTNFAIGARDTGGSSPSPMQTDEFLLVPGVLTAAEVLALSQAPRAGDGDYTAGIASQCGAGNVVLGSTGGAPAIGNLGYSFTVTTVTPSLFLLLAGFDRCTFGGVIPLPLDGTPILPLLSGCWILTDAPVVLNGVAAPSAVMPFPVPPTVPASISIYTQVLALDASTLASSMSSGFATSTGN